jgi:hypothetical protein
MQGIHPSESEPLLIARLASLDLDVVPESFTARIIRDGIDATAPAIRRAMSGARSRHFLILHEYATSLDFAPHVLLTPHVTRGMPFVPIAYLPYNVGEPVPFARRTIAASFRGSMTSPLRAKLRGCVIEDSGAFHDHHDATARAANHDRYVELLANSRIAICPRGAGAATFRFWEALAMGCVPLLISDDLVLPLEDRIDWDAIVLRLAEKDIDRLQDFVEAQDGLEAMAEEGHRVWQEWFSPENWIRGVAAAVKLRR